MSVTTAEKIFIDPNEEITFVLEKIKNTEKDKVAIVIPQNALILSSLINLALLQRTLWETDKILIIVTEDQYGTNIAQKSGFVVISKLSQLSQELWEIALSKKDRLKREHTSKSNEIKSEEHREEIQEKKESAQHEEITDKKEIENNVEEFNKLDEENLEEPKREKKIEVLRPKPEIKNIEGIEVYGGGDILSLEESSLNDKISSPKIKNQMIDRKQNGFGSSNFVGRDFTKSIKRVNFSPFSFFKKFFSPSRKYLGEDDDIYKQVSLQQKRKKIIISMLLLAPLILFTGVFLISLEGSSVEIILSFKKESVDSTAVIIADTEVKELINDPITIPAKELQVTGVSISRTGEASGVGKSGQKSVGMVRIVNKTLNPITVTSGTKITSVLTNLKYVILNDINIPAAEQTPEGIDASKATVDDVRVEAEDFGEEYNISESTSNTVFLLSGFSSSEVGVSRFNPFEGGNKTEFTIVSKQNVENLKVKIVPDLQKEAIKKIKNALPTGYKLVEESIEFENEEVISFPDIDQKSEDKTFSLTVSLDVKAIAVKRSELENAVKIILSQQESKGQEFVVENLSEPQVIGVEKIGNAYSLKISSSGSVFAKFTEEELKVMVTGNTLDEAKKFLLEMEEVNDVRIIYSPSIVPQFLRKVPHSMDKIIFKFR